MCDGASWLELRQERERVSSLNRWTQQVTGPRPEGQFVGCYVLAMTILCMYTNSQGSLLLQTAVIKV